MERRHRRQENALAALMDSAPDGILILDPDGKIVLANDAAERLFGYARNELVGEPVEFLVPLDGLPEQNFKFRTWLDPGSLLARIQASSGPPAGQGT